jgi:tetratricopeptide (TPR) repeat protein
MTTIYEGRGNETSAPFFLHKKNLRVHKSVLTNFKKVTIFHAMFKLSFFCLFIVQILFLLLSYRSSYVLAIHLGGLFLSVFSYFVLMFYFQAKKPEQLIQLREQFIASCRNSIPIPIGAAEHHLMMAQSLLRFVSHLYHFEYRYYTPPSVLSFMTSVMKRVSSFFHSMDILKMKELFYYAAIEEHVEQIRLTPTDLEVHASLANCFVSFARMYLEAKQSCKHMSRRGNKRYSEYFDKNFRTFSNSSIEELKILSEYAPNDPWVHAQLAQSYHSLELFDNEALEYEKLLAISPNDNEVKYRLAKIHFKLGNNAKALVIYEQLQMEGYKKAVDLLRYYSVMKLPELLIEGI